METPDIPLEHAYHVPLTQFLDGQKTNRPQVSWRDARNIVTRLLRQAWEQFARNRGLLLCEFAHGSAWFVPLDLIEGNIATFQDENGKKRRRRLVGRSETRGVYWHFAVSGKISITDPRHLALRTHVVFTQDGKTPLDSQSRADRLRKSFCKNWWNDRWRDLLRAFVADLADGKEEFSLSLGSDVVATIAASSMGFEAPLSITEKGSVSTAEEDHVEDETEADALDDFDSALDETDFEKLLDHEDDEHKRGYDRSLLQHIEEPRLGFRYSQELEHPKDGLFLFGPLDDRANPAEMRIGVIGTPNGLICFREWVESIRRYIPPKDPNEPHHTGWPGFQAVFGTQWPEKPLVELTVSGKCRPYFDSDR